METEEKEKEREEEKPFCKNTEGTRKREKNPYRVDLKLPVYICKPFKTSENRP